MDEEKSTRRWFRPSARRTVLIQLREVNATMRWITGVWGHGATVHDNVRRHSTRADDVCGDGPTCTAVGAGDGRVQHRWERDREPHEYAENDPKRWHQLARTCLDVVRALEGLQLYALEHAQAIEDGLAAEAKR